MQLSVAVEWTENIIYDIDLNKQAAWYYFPSRTNKNTWQALFSIPHLNPKPTNTNNPPTALTEELLQ